MHYALLGTAGAEDHSREANPGKNPPISGSPTFHAHRTSLLAANLEARVGFEPTNGGFADLSLRPLGYRAGCMEYNETATELSVASVTGEFALLECKEFICGWKIAPKCRAIPAASHRDRAGTTWASRMKRADSSGGVGQI